MNILLTSIGHHVYMVKAFKKALEGKGLVHVANASPETPAFGFADKHVVAPRSYEESYIDFLLDYCKDNDIDAVIPFMDIDLKPLSANKDRFGQIGTTVIVADYDFIEACSDKWATYKYLCENGLKTPRSYIDLDELLADLKNGSIDYPIIVKARFGAGSMGLYMAANEEELLQVTKETVQAVQNTHMRFSTGNNSPVIYQEMLKGDEYGVDIINDLQGKHLLSIVKRKFGMLGGETSGAETLHTPAIEKACDKLGELSGHLANIDCDVFLVDGEAYILEINPRFGGGFPFTHTAGCDLPRAIVCWLMGETPAEDMLEPAYNVRASKFFDVGLL